MTYDHGELLELDSAGGRWQAKRLVDLGNVPTAYSTLPGDSLLIATMRAVQAVHFDEKPLVLYRSDIFPYLQASSIVRDRAGVIYLTTGRIILRLRPVEGGYREDWLVPVSCRRMSRVPRTMSDCKCDAEAPVTR